MNNVKFVSATPDAEQLMAYCARVSNPANQDNPEISRLLAYCLKHGHWSVFEQANMVLEISTSRSIAPQILRHRSFCFQEFSQRYASPSARVAYRARRQDQKNRQNSVDDLGPEIQAWFATAQEEVWELAYARYQEALSQGIAKECARVLLPASAATTLYMNGTLRSWIHYIQLRTTPGTQAEHAAIAESCRRIFCERFPIVASALEWRAGSP